MDSMSKLTKGQENVVLHFKTKKCKNPLHFLFDEDYSYINVQNNCVFFHTNQDTRRPINSINSPQYTFETCLQTPCNDFCPKSHNLFEKYFHPNNYKTQKCPLGDDCALDSDHCSFQHEQKTVEAKVNLKSQPFSGEENQLTLLQDKQIQSSQQDFVPPETKDQNQINQNQVQQKISENKSIRSGLSQISQSEDQVSQRQRALIFINPCRQNNNYFHDRYINLVTFKTTLCEQADNSNHNKRKCPYYHSYLFNFRNYDRRRPQTFKYLVDKCQDPSNCADGDYCKFSHNQIEQLYHLERFKKKFCTHYPNDIKNCQYGDFCNFAHNKDEIRIRLIHDQKQFPHNKVFFMYLYKTETCPFIFQHDRQDCVYAHNPQDFRRQPIATQEQKFFKDLNLLYTNQNCTQWRRHNQITSYTQGGCPDMISCGFCHGWKELDFHPHQYKKHKCQKEAQCNLKGFCPNWHNEQERRGELSDDSEQIINQICIIFKIVDPNEMDFVPQDLKQHSNSTFTSNSRLNKYQSYEKLSMNNPDSENLIIFKFQKNKKFHTTQSINE